MQNNSIKTFLLIMALIPLCIAAGFALSLCIVLLFFNSGGDMRAIGQAVFFLLLGIAICMLLIPLTIGIAVQHRKLIFNNDLVFNGTLCAGFIAVAILLNYILN